VLVEIVHAHGKLEEYVSRKLAHAGAGVIFLLLPLWFHSGEIAVIALAFVLGLFISHRSGKSSIHRRDRETLGEYYYPLALGLTAALLLPSGDWRAYTFAVAVLAFGDGMAELVGRGFGTHVVKFVAHKKTWEGSMSLFIVTFIAFILLVPEITLMVTLLGIIVSILVMYTEIELNRGLDNLALPILSGGLFLLALSLA
jgi:phytol kinase